MNAPHQQWLDALIDWVTSGAATEDVVHAKHDFFQKTGTPFEDDPQFEQRMVGFLEHYVCERKLPERGATPAVYFYQNALQEGPAEKAHGFGALTRTHHALFEVAKHLPEAVILTSVFSDLVYRVSERRSLKGLNDGALLECRLVPWDGTYYFTESWCLHPREATALVRKRIELLRSQNQAIDEEVFVAQCAQRALKADRYRQISVKKIYDFESRVF